MRATKTVLVILVLGSSWALVAGLATQANGERPHRPLAPSHVTDTGVASFNQAFAAATRSMNNEAVLSLWEDDGVALLPDTPPVKGKSEIRSMMQSISLAHPKAKMESFTDQCFDIESRGRWASEWCLEHQIVSEPGKPIFDSWGKMLLVLHRQGSGGWRLSREMWNEAVPSETLDRNGHS